MAELAQQTIAFLHWAHQNGATGDQRGEVAAALTGHVGPSIAGSVVAREIPQMELVNLQVALEAWIAEEDRTVDVRGLFVPRNYSDPDLVGLAMGQGPPVSFIAPPVADLPDGPASTRACWTRCLLLVTEGTTPYALLLYTPEHEPVIRLEVAGLPVERAQAVLTRLEELRNELDVYRGHLVQAFAPPMGGLRLEFLDPTPLRREQLILPEDVLERVEEHALGIAEHRQALRDAGQHLKRGVLLHGPPGTGKTHTIRYVLGRMPGYTRVLLQGAALQAVGPASQLARRLAPAVLVLEDVDLVAQDRSFGMGDNPVLFELLDAMDGAAEDTDLLFVLTTNRVEVLEEALAARPGRVDVAVHVDRPDHEARARLFRLYAAAAPLDATDDLTDEVASATAGVTASFMKELVRRSVLLAVMEGSATVAPEHVRRALTELHDSAQGVTRALLGVLGDGDETADDGEPFDDTRWAAGVIDQDGPVPPR